MWYTRRLKNFKEYKFAYCILDIYKVIAVTKISKTEGNEVEFLFCAELIGHDDCTCVRKKTFLGWAFLLKSFPRQGFKCRYFAWKVIS